MQPRRFGLRPYRPSISAGIHKWSHFSEIGGSWRSSNGEYIAAIVSDIDIAPRATTN